MHHSEWEDIYHTNEPQSNTTNQKYNVNSGDFYANKVVFHSLGDSGVIYLDFANENSLISSCTFLNSSNTGDQQGGSITIKNCQSALRKVCSIGSKSTAGNGGRFSRIEVANDANSLNYYSEMSIFNNNQGYISGYNGIYILNGRISFTKNNLTKNSCKYNSAIGIESTHGKVNYSFFDDNKSDSRLIMQIFQEIHYNSLIISNNTVKIVDYRFPEMIDCSEGKSFFENCYFVNNNQGPNYLFGAFSATIALSKCLIVSNNAKIHSGPGTFKTECPQQPEIVLDLYSTECCPGNVYQIYSNIITASKIYSSFMSNLNDALQS